LKYLEDLNYLEIKINNLSSFWQNSHSWAPWESAEKLRISRFDWNLSLIRILKPILKNIDDNEPGKLIICYTILGTLLENIFKIILVIYITNYNNDAFAIRDNKGKIIHPLKLNFENLKNFIIKRILISETLRKENNSIPDYYLWISKIQIRRNSIHALQPRDIGNLVELKEDISILRTIIDEITDHLPYP